ncbi:hypothetical protein [Methylobacterium gregans]|uniref:Uncharacterized protein n=1 Tax=Methylobacterium gregans TaxID=374424 RepID=A0AA37HQ56_9HYPH|nr:hypothetical protein [Methylobacterium gregans]MDQ0522476.1 hypothetical protein [Methylobacterium gregans]GJD79521.1 hypothetical protein NBEOAGPD_2750 [Methylobacterium gregans]GLS55224.1 hypothetical protein GCM10007886_34080 [Methylobacterium gregans]
MLKDDELDELARAVAALDDERARHAADAEALREVIHQLRPGAAIVRIDEPTTGRHRYQLFTNLSAQPPEDTEFLSKVYGVPWTEELKRTSDAPLSAVGSFQS